MKLKEEGGGDKEEDEEEKKSMLWKVYWNSTRFKLTSQAKHRSETSQKRFLDETTNETAS